MDMTITFDKPEGFDKWFSTTLADCVAKGIVEKAVQKIHKNTAEAEKSGEVVGGN